MSKKHKVLLTVMVVGLGGALAGFGVFSAFSSTTSNPGNSFAAGSVTISDNDSGSALYNVSNQKPGQSVTKCIKVTYGGSLDSDVRIYASAVAAGGQYMDLLIESGTGNDPDCSDWTIDGSGTPTVYSGTLKAFADARTDWASGLADYKLAQTKWATNDAVTYRFTVTMQDNPSAQGATSGSHSFTWEARNQ
jgi:hypothetical protein